MNGRTQQSCLTARTSMTSSSPVRNVCTTMERKRSAQYASDGSPRIKLQEGLSRSPPSTHYICIQPAIRPFYSLVRCFVVRAIRYDTAARTYCNIMYIQRRRQGGMSYTDNGLEIYWLLLCVYLDDTYTQLNHSQE